MHELAEQFLSHLAAIWRYRWYAVISAWIIALGGWAAVYKMPESYEATARIYADTESVLRPLLSGLAVQPNLDQVVAMMSQTLISGPNLEKVIEMAGLGASRTEDDRVKLIARLRTEISIKSAGKQNIYTVSCIDRDPEVAKKIVESLITLFVEGSLTGNRKDSDSARVFIDEQLDSYRDKLEASERSIMEFKRRNVGFMPGEGQGYFARLDEARLSLRRSTLDLKEAENAMESIRQRLAQVPEISLSVDGKSGDPAVPETELGRRIVTFEKKLDDLRLTYTEQHPDIIALVRTIEQLKEQRKDETDLANARLAMSAQPKEVMATTNQARNPLYQQLSLSLTAAESNVAVMKTRVAEYGQRYAELQSIAGAMPQVEAAYTQLTRDYEVNKARYAELLKRRDTAQMSGEMESSNSAMSFRIVDPPRVISINQSPLLLATMVLLAAFGGGIGIAFLFSQIKPTINDERRLKELSELPVLGTVIMAVTEPQKTRKRWSFAAFLLSIASLCSAYGVIMATLLTASRV